MSSFPRLCFCASGVGVPGWRSAHSIGTGVPKACCGCGTSRLSVAFTEHANNARCAHGRCGRCCGRGRCECGWCRCGRCGHSADQECGCSRRCFRGNGGDADTGAGNSRTEINSDQGGGSGSNGSSKSVSGRGSTSRSTSSRIDAGVGKGEGTGDTAEGIAAGSEEDWLGAFVPHAWCEAVVW